MWKKMLSVTGSIVVFIVLAIGGLIGKELGKTAYSPSKPTALEREAGLVEVANRKNQELPIMLDEETRLNKITVGPGLRMVYHITALKYRWQDVDVNLAQKNFRRNTAKSLCANPDTEKAIQDGVIFVYVYSGFDGVEILRLEINDCSLSASLGDIEMPSGFPKE
jgi:hypothetical protein